MTRKYIPVAEAAKEWMKDPEFREAYDTLEEEFVLAEAFIRARAGGSHPRAGGGARGHDAGGGGAPEERPGEALDAHAGAVRQGDGHAAAHPLRAGADAGGRLSALTPQQIAEFAAAVRARTSRPFAINIFAPVPPPEPPGDMRPALERVAPFHAELNLPPPALPTATPSRFEEGG